MNSILNKTIFILLVALGSSSAFSASWKHGTVNIAESFSDKLLIQWTGPNTEYCAQGSNTVVITKSAVGSEEALDRAFKIALLATVSGRPIRFHLNGCYQGRQKADVVQLCAKSTCAY